MIYSNACLNLKAFKFLREFDDLYASKTEKQIMKLFIAKVLCSIFLCGYGHDAVCYLQSFTVVPLKQNVMFFAKIKIVIDQRVKNEYEFVITNALDYKNAMLIVSKDREIKNPIKIYAIAEQMTALMIDKLQKTFGQKFIKSTNINLANVSSLHIEIDLPQEKELNSCDGSNKNSINVLPSDSKITSENSDKIGMYDDRNNSRMGEPSTNIAEIHKEKILDKSNIIIPSHSVLSIKSLDSNSVDAKLDDYFSEVVNEGYHIRSSEI